MTGSILSLVKSASACKVWVANGFSIATTIRVSVRYIGMTACLRTNSPGTDLIKFGSNLKVRRPTKGMPSFWARTRLMLSRVTTCMFTKMSPRGIFRSCACMPKALSSCSWVISCSCSKASPRRICGMFFWRCKTSSSCVWPTIFCRFR